MFVNSYYQRAYRRGKKKAGERKGLPVVYAQRNMWPIGPVTGGASRGIKTEENESQMARRGVFRSTPSAAAPPKR